MTTTQAKDRSADHQDEDRAIRLLVVAHPADSARASRVVLTGQLAMTILVI
jgi:hypothetical protein